ncbi:MAG: universal stress protein [Chloroflexi bacterium]|nr:universal stress protein [Chloroflexota bacterium]
MFKKVLVGYDGSPGSRTALSAALEMSRSSDVQLWCVSVEENLPAYASTVGEVQEEKERANQVFQALHREATEKAADLGIHLHTRLLAGYPAKAIVAFAQEGGFDLIVLGHSGRSGVWGNFLGSTAEKVTRHAPCSVLVAR